MYVYIYIYIEREVCTYLYTFIYVYIELALITIDKLCFILQHIVYNNAQLINYGYRKLRT